MCMLTEDICKPTNDYVKNRNQKYTFSLLIKHDHNEQKKKQS